MGRNDFLGGEMNGGETIILKGRNKQDELNRDESMLHQGLLRGDTYAESIFELPRPGAYVCGTSNRILRVRKFLPAILRSRF